MATGSGLLAMALATVGAGPGAGDEGISYRLRVLTIDGLGWRSTYYHRLQPVARQGTSTIWTADRALAQAMAGQASSASAPMRCVGTGETSVGQVTRAHYVAHLERVADGPKNQASALAWMPETAALDEGVRAVVAGRRLDQGILARVSIEEAHVKAIHEVRMSESLVPAPRPCEDKPTSAMQVVGQFLKAVEEKASGKCDPKFDIQVQVPEVARARVDGEWLVPRDGVLLVSLGVETVADAKGMAAVRERVAMLEFDPTEPGAAMTRAGFEAVRAPLAPPAALAIPATPARSIPEAVDPAGRVIDLPPLPEAVASADLNRIPPDPALPSAQAPHLAGMLPDDQVARAGFEAPEPTPAPGTFGAWAPMVGRIGEMLAGMGMTLDVDLSAADGSVQGFALKSIRNPEQAEGCEMGGCCREGEAATSRKAPDGPDREIAARKFLHSTNPHFPITPVPPAASPDAPGGPIKAFRIDTLLKNPGKAETVRVPLGGRLAVEIQATVVPAGPGEYKQIQKIDRPTANP